MNFDQFNISKQSQFKTIVCIKIQEQYKLSLSIYLYVREPGGILKVRQFCDKGKFFLSKFDFQKKYTGTSASYYYYCYDYFN